MCGIVGFTGHKQAAEVLLNGLGRLEYRGYDSAGIAVLDGDDKIKMVKATGKLKNLIEKTEQGKSLPGHCGIGHTRWATHGEPNEINAHPHISGYLNYEDEYTDSNVVGVHNGIIENYEELKEKLFRHDYKLYSQTDTEIAIKIVDYYYKKYKIGPIDAINRMMVRVRGSYALALMFKDYPGEIYVARKDSPMIIGVTDDETYLASDASAILNYTREVYYIGNHQAARLTPGEVHFYDLNGDEITIPKTEITWDAKAAEKNGFEHFMMKEIHEQPDAIRKTLESVCKSGKIDMSVADIDDDYLKSVKSITIVACGSAWHVGMASQYILEEMAEIPVRVELASEYRYRKNLWDKDNLVIVISQSGETADTLEALRIAKEHGVCTLGIVNVEGSSIARDADKVLYTKAGPEISVATTKAFTAQLILMYALAVQLAYVREKITKEKYTDYINELREVPDKISILLMQKEKIQWIASKYSSAKDAFFIGRNSDYAISMEGSLKLKEISYVHSEAYAAGELKHGTISLIENNTPVIGVLTQKNIIEKTISNMKECKARGAYLIGITDDHSSAVKDSVDYTISIPEIEDCFAGILAVVPLQLLGYYISVSKGLDVDKPRNLAKSVTVE